jgi:hypothetical protein
VRGVLQHATIASRPHFSAGAERRIALRSIEEVRGAKRTRVRWVGAIGAIAMATCLFACLFAGEREARADFDFQLAAGTGVAFMRNSPSLTSKAVETSARSMPDGKVPMTGGLTMLGVYADVAGRFRCSAVVSMHRSVATTRW